MQLKLYFQSFAPQYHSWHALKTSLLQNLYLFIPGILDINKKSRLKHNSVKKSPPFLVHFCLQCVLSAKKKCVWHEVLPCNLPPYTFPQLSIIQFGPKKNLLFLLHLCAATYRLIHFRSCQMGRGPCRAVTLHPTSYCTVTLFVLCHSNEVLLCQKCTIPVQMRSQRAAVPLLCANSCRTGRGFDQVNSVLGTVYSIYKYQVLSHDWQ